MRQLLFAFLGPVWPTCSRYVAVTPGARVATENAATRLHHRHGARVFVQGSGFAAPPCACRSTAIFGPA